MTTRNPEPIVNHQGEISLLDLGAVLVENLRLLLLGPVLVALLAYGASWLWPVKYQSTAVQSGDVRLAAMYKSAQVLDAVAAELQLALPGEDADSTRQRLAREIQVQFNAKDRTLTIQARAEQPKVAQAMAQAAIKHAAVLNQPRQEALERLREQLTLTQTREAAYALSAENIGKDMATRHGTEHALLAQAQAQMVDAAQQSQTLMVQLSSQLREAETFDLLQSPTLPTKKVSPKRTLVGLLAGLGAGFVLVLWVFVRHAWIRVQADPGSADRLVAIRKGWKRFLGQSR